MVDDMLLFCFVNDIFVLILSGTPEVTFNSDKIIIFYVRRRVIGMFYYWCPWVNVPGTPEVSCFSDKRFSFTVDDVLLVCFDIDVGVSILSGSPEVSCDSNKSLFYGRQHVIDMF